MSELCEGCARGPNNCGGGCPAAPEPELSCEGCGQGIAQGETYYAFTDFAFCENCANTLTLSDLSYLLGGGWETAGAWEEDDAW